MNETQFAHFKVALIETLQDASLTDEQMVAIYKRVLTELQKNGLQCSEDVN